MTQPYDASKPRVLIVDDEGDIRDTLADVLADEGYEVATATNGLEALQRIDRDGAPQLVLVDLMMPVMNGWDLHRRLRHHPHCTKTLVIAVSAVRIADCGHDATFDGYLQKPFDLQTLLSTVGAATKAA